MGKLTMSVMLRKVINGKDGEKGDTGATGPAGADAITLRATSGSETAFTAVQVETVQTRGTSVYLLAKVAKSVSLGLYKGTTLITSGVTFSLASSKTLLEDDTSSTVANDVYNCIYTTSSGVCTVSLTTSSGIKAQLAATDSDNTQHYVPVTNPSLTVTAVYGGEKYTMTLPISVDFTAQWSSIIKSDSEISLSVSEMKSNLNLIDDIPQPTLTDAKIKEIFQDIYVNGTVVTDPTPPTTTTSNPWFAASTVEGIRIPVFKAMVVGDKVEFNRPYASYVTSYPKQYCSLIFSMKYKATGDFYIGIGINQDNDTSEYITGDGGETWRILNLEFKANDAEAAVDDDLAVTIISKSSDCSLYIASMILQYEGGVIASSMGYVDVKSDEVKLGVKSDFSEAGLDITNKTVKVKAEKFYVVNNDDEQTMAVNSKGELQAGSVVSEGNQRIEMSGGLLSMLVDGSSERTGFVFTTDGTSDLPILYYYKEGVPIWYLGEEGVITKIADNAISLDVNNSSADTDYSTSKSGSNTTITIAYTVTIVLYNSSASDITINSGYIKARVGAQYSNGSVSAVNSGAFSVPTKGRNTVVLTVQETKTFTSSSYVFPQYGSLVEILYNNALIGTIEADKQS